MKQWQKWLGGLAVCVACGVANGAENDSVNYANNGDTPDQPVPAVPFSHVPLNAISPETLRTFVGTFDLVRRKYAEPVDDETLFRHAIGGMLKQLDSHAEYLDEVAFKNLQSFAEGGVADVGLSLEFDKTAGFWVVQSIAKPMEKSVGDVAVGDYVHQIRDKKLDGNMTSDEVAQLMLGIMGSQLELVISKAGRNKHSVNLQRLNPQSNQVSITVYGDVVAVRIPVFTERTRNYVIDGLARIHQPIKGIVLDVRNNPGGVLSSAIGVASLFMADTPAVQVVERGQMVQTLTTHSDAPLEKMPVMVLQNRYSASAAEVLALALKQDKEAVIAGERSYGKGSIQSIFPVGNAEAIKLTTAHYTGVDGQKINGVGVKPDVVIDFGASDWLQTVSNEMNKRKLDVGVLVTLPSDY